MLLIITDTPLYLSEDCCNCNEPLAVSFFLIKRDTVIVHNVKWLQLMDQLSGVSLHSSLCCDFTYKRASVNSQQPCYWFFRERRRWWRRWWWAYTLTCVMWLSLRLLTGDTNWHWLFRALSPPVCLAVIHSTEAFVDAIWL